MALYAYYCAEFAYVSDCRFHRHLGQWIHPQLHDATRIVAGDWRTNR